MSTGDAFGLGLLCAGFVLAPLLTILISSRRVWREQVHVLLAQTKRLEEEVANLRAECGRCRDCGTKEVPRLFFTPHGAGTKCECGNITNLD